MADHDLKSIDDGAKKRVVIQRNPTSGSGRGGQQIRILARELKSAGYQVRLFANRDRLDEFLDQPKIHTDVACLVAAGGDGTVASLAHRHPEFPIATLPLGTENLVARHLQIPRCGRTVAKLIQKNVTRTFDTGFVDDQRFLLMVSAGLDAEVVRRLSSVRSGNISHVSYVWPILQSFLGYKGPVVDVHNDTGDVTASGTHVVVTNIGEYGFRMKFCPDADPQDGLLDVRVFTKRGRIRTILHALRVKLGFADRVDDVIRFQATSVELRSAGAAPVQFDGDPAGQCPVKIRIDPQSMKLIVNE